MFIKCIILSETFYYEKEKSKKEEDNKKIYLIDYIKYYKWFLTLDFWKGIIENMIQKEIINNEKLNKNNKVNETTEEKKKNISNISFSIVLSYTNTMIEFNIEKENINNIVDFFVKKYNIEKNIAQTIYENVNLTPLPEINEENKKIFEELFIEFEKNKVNENKEEKNKEIKNKNDIENKEKEENNVQNKNLECNNVENNT